MKLTRQEILHRQLKVFVQDSVHRSRLVMFPESVNTETGEVEMWVIPTTNIDLEERNIDMNPPKEIDGFAQLKKVTGKVVLKDVLGQEVEL